MMKLTLKKVDVYKEIENPNRNFFISASAGTGKTYILTQYYIKILEKNFPNSDIIDNILTVTFTNKAASEMKDRILENISKKLDEKPPYGINELDWHRYWNEIKINFPRSWIRTIDSFCSRIIRENNISIGVDPNFTIINTFQNDREIERSVYSALRLVLEIYENKKIDWLNFLSPKRRESIENYIKEINSEKIRFKNAFKEFLKNFGLESLENALKEIMQKWRLEMTKSLIIDDLELDDKSLSKIYTDFLWLFKYISLIATEFYLGLTVDSFLFDFKAVLEKVLSEFENKDWLLKKYQNKFKYVIVDEYQDTNYLQKEIFDQIHTKDNFFFYVGDRKQSIYRFRGADVSVFSRTLTDAENSREEVLLGELTINRRSHKEIVDFANYIAKESLFKKEILNSNGIDPDLLENLSFHNGDISSYDLDPLSSEKIPTLSNKDNKRVKYLLIEPTEEEPLTNKDHRITYEVEATAKAIKKLIGKEMDFKERKGNEVNYERRKIEPKDIAVLLREMSSTEKVIREIFPKYNIPFYIFGSKSFYTRAEIQAIFAAINTIQNPYNDYQFVRYMMSLLVGMSFQELDKLVENREGSLYETFEKIEDQFPEDIKNSYETLKKYKDIKYYLSPSSILKGIIYENDYFSKLALTNEPEVCISNVKKLISQSEEYNSIANSFSELIRFLKKASTISEEEASLEDEQSNSVKVMTIHKAKGLEFPIVFLLGLHNSISQKKNSNNNKDYIEFSIPDSDGNRYYLLKKVFDENLENTDHWLLKWFKNNEFLDNTEANRLAYVGITRAKDVLIPVIVDNQRNESLNNFFSMAKNSNINIINHYDIEEIDSVAIDSKTKTSDDTFQDIPPENLKDLTNLSYKKYIAPTYLIREVKPPELELMEDLNDSPNYALANFDPSNIFSDEELIFRGSDLHAKLNSAQNISHIKNMIENGELPQGFDEIEIIKKAFTPNQKKIIKNEWRLMKQIKVKNREYMLFGIPDKVIIENGEIEILDYKYSELDNPNKIKDYNFQIQFYLYLLSDFGTPKKGYIVSIKRLKKPIIFDYDPNFEETLFDMVSKIYNSRDD